MAEKEGFEPSRDLRLLSVFETDPFSLLGISPRFNDNDTFVYFQIIPTYDVV